jgi:integrase
MVRSELMGDHTHTTLAGVEVHIWQRGNKYIARGSYGGQRFGETLGTDVAAATARLRQLLTEIEGGSFVRPSDANKRLVAKKKILRLSVRDLVSDFVNEIRKSRGQQTAGDYRARLGPVLAFAEQASNFKRWPLAEDIDRDFVVALKSYLYQFRTSRNGRPGAGLKVLSPRQVVNVMQCLRTLLAWASSPTTRKLPADWTNPLTKDVMPRVPDKDPLREDKLPLDLRVRLVDAMDQWQLCHLGLSLVLPLRPDEAAGLLISDVNFERGWLEFGHSFMESNFTKAGTAFKLPFPDELIPVLKICIGGRSEGPLLQMRRAFEAGAQSDVSSTTDLKQRFDNLLLEQPRDNVQCPQDRKLLFRSLLRRLGGISEDTMNREFKGLLAMLGINNGATIYTARASITQSMKTAKLPFLELRYLTSHTTNDILNVYSSLDPVGAMKQYFDSIKPLLAAIEERARVLVCPSDTIW